MLVVVLNSGKYFVKNGKKGDIVAGPFANRTEARCYSKFSRSQRRRFHKRKYISKAKDRPCNDCGFKETLMTFDHVRGKKQFNIGDGTRFSWSLLRKEMAKCEVVCRPCHNVREYLRGVAAKLTAIEDLSTLLLRVGFDAL